MTGFSLKHEISQLPGPERHLVHKRLDLLLSELNRECAYGDEIHDGSRLAWSYASNPDLDISMIAYRMNQIHQVYQESPYEKEVQGRLKQAADYLHKTLDPLEPRYCSRDSDTSMLEMLASQRVQQILAPEFQSGEWNVPTPNNPRTLVIRLADHLVKEVLVARRNNLPRPMSWKNLWHILPNYSSIVQIAMETARGDEAPAAKRVRRTVEKYEEEREANPAPGEREGNPPADGELEELEEGL